ncbi:MAG: lipoate---protein ligase [Clostridiales bacterium]|nr:lipoate---protein ligase [Clostridiales bacterium]
MTLYISTQHNPIQNFALEEAFFFGLPPEESILILWVNAPSVIIGRNQNPWREVHLENLLTDGIPLIRRLSGGGAVYHDQGNLNFTFIESARDYHLDTHFELIIEAVRTLGIALMRNERGDMNLNGMKVSGNAFFIRGNRKLHHGTMLVDTDEAAIWRYLKPLAYPIEAKGIPSKLSAVTKLSAVSSAITIQRVMKAIQETYLRMYPKAATIIGAPMSILPTSLHVDYQKVIQKLTSWDWAYGETPNFTYYFDASSYALIEGGVVTKIFGNTAKPPLPGVRVEGGQ